MQLSKNPRAVVFDMDGVLVNSAPSHERAFLTVFKSEGISEFEYAEFAGRRTLDVVEEVFRQAGRELDPANALLLAERKSRIAREYQAIDDPTVPGCSAVLSELARSFRLGLASSGSRKSVEIFLERGQFAPVFSSVLTGDDVVHAKPHPEIYARSFETLGIEPYEALVVEDAVSGIEAAQSASAGVIVGIAGTHQTADLLAAGATEVLHRLTDLPTFLRSRLNAFPNTHV